MDQLPTAPRVAEALGKRFLLKVSLLSRGVSWGAVCHWVERAGGAALRLLYSTAQEPGLHSKTHLDSNGFPMKG